MTKRTTDEWEALLGRWVYDKQTDKLLGARERFSKVREQEKAAPEAVAEVVRLRRELEELREKLLNEAESAEGEPGDRETLDAFAATARVIFDELTRILEGDSND